MQPIQTTHAAWGALVLLIPLFLIGLVMFAFWVWMLVDCVKNEGLVGNEKLIWVLVVIFTGIIGAVIYCFVARPKRKAVQPPLVG